MIIAKTMTTNRDGYKVEMMGSDSEIKLDGRKSISNLVIDAREAIKKLKNVHPQINSFKLIRKFRDYRGVMQYRDIASYKNETMRSA